MRKITILLAVATIAAQSVGCGCCNRMRDWLCRGAYCGTSAPVCAAPAPYTVPAPMMTAPVAATSVPCMTCPPCYPMETSFEPSCGYGAGMPMYTEGGGQWVPSGGGVMMTDPGPAAP